MRVTVKVIEPLSSTALASAMDSRGRGSSSVIVPVAVTPAASAVPSALPRVTVNVSSSSEIVSCRMVTTACFVVSPGAKVTVPAATAV